MVEKIRCLNFFVLMILLVGFSADFIGADSLPNEVDAPGEEEVLQVVEEEVILEEEIVVEENFEYVDIDEIVDFVENESEEVNDSFEVVENVSEILENESEVFVEENSSDLENESEENFEYIDIDALLENESMQREEFPEEEIGKDVVLEKIVERQFKNGRLELEFEVLEGRSVEIRKKEVVRDDFEKDVLISSEEHFEDEVRVFSDLPSPAKREDIVVVWENEDLEVNDLEYFDEDSDGLVERISWVVPHLSSQHYSIRIVVSGQGNSVGVILLNVSAPVNGSTVSNPVNFSIAVDYLNLSNVECGLYIDGAALSSLFGENGTSFVSELESGSHDWKIYCRDYQNNLINASAFGYFNVFNFSINAMDNFYFNNKNISGSVNSQGEFSLKLRRGGEEFSVSHSGANFLIDSSKISVPGNYELIATTGYYNQSLSVSKNFSVGSVSVSFPSSAEANDDVSFVVGANNVLGTFVYDLYAGNMEIISTYGPRTIAKSFAEGSYVIQLKNINVNGKPYPDMSFGTLSVVNSGDTNRPDIILIFPGDEDEVDSDDITFEYEVEDDVGVANCSLKIYESDENMDTYYTRDLIYPISSADKALALQKNLGLEKRVELRLVDFDPGYYAYEVTCFDTSGNDWDESNFFSVDLNGTRKALSVEANYERKEEIEDLIAKMNSFLEKEDDFGLEERRILEILGLSKDMAAWKKKVVQMDQDLKFNLKFMEAAKREVRIREIYSDIDEIKKKIVLDVRSVDSYEFSKGSVDIDMEEVIGNYLSESGTEMSKGSLKALAEYNEGLQKDLDVSVETWKIEMDYLSGTREIVLVNKNLDVSGDDDLQILEIIPDKYASDLKMVSSADEIGKGIYSVDVRDLEDGNLVYYFEDGFALKEVEKMESILFGEGVGRSGFGISGMFVGVGDTLNFGSFFWLPLFLFLGYVGFLVSGKVRLEAWKKEPGVEELVRLINDTSVLIREGRVDAARANYKRMSEIYKALPVKCRDFFYKEIKRLHLAIDKKDVLNLIKEYEAAKDSFRKQDAVMLHGKINAIYRKLPKKFQEKVYRRLVKKEV